MAQPDRLAEYDFSKEDTLILGGTRGFGRELGMDLKRRGVRNLALGTSSLSSRSYITTIEQFVESGINTQGVIPFEADLKDSQQVEDAIDRLPFKTRHVFMLPATGMQFAREFGQEISKLQAIKHHPERYEEGAMQKALEELHILYDRWLPENLEDAVGMNLLASVRTLESLTKHFKEDGFTFTYLDSSFGDQGRGPRYYTNVLTKHMFGIWLSQNAKSYARRGVDVARIIAPAILGTDIGDFLVDEISEVEDPKVAEKLMDTAVEPVDIFDPIYQFMFMSKEERAKDGLPFERYVYRQDGRVFITRSFPSQLHIDSSKFQL